MPQRASPSAVFFQPNTPRKTQLNSTQLNSELSLFTVHFSFSLYNEPATTCNDPRQFDNEIGGRCRFFTIRADSRESTNQCNVCCWSKTGDELRRLVSAVAGSWLPTTCDGRHQSSQLVVSSTHSGQEALLSQRGRAMLRVCIASIQNVERSLLLLVVSA